MLLKFDPAAFPMRLEGDCKGQNLLPLVAKVRESISSIPLIDVDFFCENENLALESIVGKTMHLVAEDDEKTKKRWFRGTCVSAEFVGNIDVGGHYRAEVRPWLWFLTRRTDLRVFQQTDVIEIIRAVLEEYGFSGYLQVKTDHTYKKREYCIQYRETDFAFISRLMEEEGIYYYFDHDGDTEKMIIADAPGAHVDISSPSKLLFLPYNMKSALEGQQSLIFELNNTKEVRSGKVSLDDYDFENSTANLKVESQTTGVQYIDKKNDLYDVPGRYKKADLGEHYSRVRMEAETAHHNVMTGVSDAAMMSVGKKFEIEKSPRPDDPTKLMLIECEHQLLQLQALEESTFAGGLASTGALDAEAIYKEAHTVRFCAIDSAEQYRSPQITPWPNIGGIHTAVVTGPKGEEIYTDKYGRIKVQFHWDKDGKLDDKSSCWVRTMMPWTGKNWGSIWIPRIGQEVVMQFEEGDPDRPMCIGMLYNDKTMPPYKLPENKTQSGVKTNSSLKGGGFNELMFEDKKGSELVRFQSEKNYQQIVKNNADITVGLEKKDEGNLTLEVHNNVDDTINEGNYTELIKKGNHKTTLDTGNHETLLKKGNMKVDVKMGSITVTAGKKIEFKVGASKIVMDPKSITVESPTVNVKANIKADLSSPMTTVKGDTMLTLKGGFVFIN